MIDWISVKDRLPRDDQTVFCWTNKRESGIPLICWYDEDENVFVPMFCDQEIIPIVDYWMPLPEPPNKT